ncbi:MAG TPA: universal stress protein [Acidimicrobiales bacterium]|nr:universal stress protein [Acidimicrobiales bacterium]
MTEHQGPDPDSPEPARIVVGVDGSAAALDALGWAAREARLRGGVLQVVYAMTFRRDFLNLYPEVERLESRVLDEAVARAEELEPTIEVVGIAVDPPAPKALVEASDGADLLVVGSRGLGGFEGLTLGSVSQQCAHHARCPIVIIRPEESGRGKDRRRPRNEGKGRS